MALDPSTLLLWADRHRELARQLLRSPGQPDRIRRWRGSKSPENSDALPLVLYSQVAWDDVWQRPQELARGLACHRPVLWVGPVQTHQTAGPLTGRWELLRLEEQDRLAILSPQILSGEYRSAPVRRANRAIVARAVAPFLKGRRFLMLTNTPFAAPLVRRLRPVATGYDLIDDFCAFEWAPPDGRAMERDLIRRASFGFSGTWALHERFEGRVPRLQWLPSGADVEKLTRPAPEPEDLRGLARPRLLYVGTLNDRIDGELIARTARALPEASIILVGPRRATFGRPSFPKNVMEFGLKPHDALAGYYQHCDAGLMPFADNAAARAINPVKTLEYLSAGLPVLSTPVPDVERFYTPPVVVAPARDWPERLRDMLRNDSPDAREERRAFARGRSWKAMVAQAEETLRAVEARLGD